MGKETRKKVFLKKCELGDSPTMNPAQAPSANLATGPTGTMLLRARNFQTKTLDFAPSRKKGKKIYKSKIVLKKHPFLFEKNENYEGSPKNNLRCLQKWGKVMKNLNKWEVFGRLMRQHCKNINVISLLEKNNGLMPSSFEYTYK